MPPVMVKWLILKAVFENHSKILCPLLPISLIDDRVICNACAGGCKVNIEPELRAMITVYEALQGLDSDAKVRVIDWVLRKFQLRHSSGFLPVDEQEAGGVGAQKKDIKDFDSVADVFALANPKNTADKAIVVAAYLQVSKGGIDVSGREINKELTQMGHGVQNITRAVEPLIRKKPQLLIQTRKEGKTKQAQKKYRVTNEGFAFVKNLVNRVEQGVNS